ncbi:MAG: hypothetical protein AVDCRST_MAG56-7201 [uncultured Cytophagales bacterium]|uniref:Uncharacterized protein n=1 Tax=uncultured Cytophagales bacterium TaxID=158755 RepID=A0A6J4LFJ2_9SPHI|nr:MAG: hypothetical protein AVDCRST_MAG56-7201 [uncultured Cytophagales bacterium]
MWLRQTAFVRKIPLMRPPAATHPAVALLLPPHPHETPVEDQASKNQPVIGRPHRQQGPRGALKGVRSRRKGILLHYLNK